MGGSSLVTADSQVVAIGRPVRLKAIHILSSGGGAAVVSIKSGGSSGTIWVTETGTTSTGKTVYYGEDGIFIPSGLYVDVDGNTTSVVLSYSVQAT